MLEAFPEAFGTMPELESEPDQDTIKAVLGKSAHDSAQYTEDQRKLFLEYHRLFKLGSNPAAHLEAISNLTDEELQQGMPESLLALVKEAETQLKEIPE